MFPLFNLLHPSGFQVYHTPRGNLVLLLVHTSCVTIHIHNITINNTTTVVRMSTVVVLVVHLGPATTAVRQQQFCQVFRSDWKHVPCFKPLDSVLSVVTPLYVNGVIEAKVAHCQMASRVIITSIRVEAQCRVLCVHASYRTGSDFLGSHEPLQY